MKGKYYFDTSIWLDFLENRNEPNLPKSDWARNLVKKISEKGEKILYSDLNVIELEDLGYSIYEIKELFSPLSNFLEYVEATKKEVGKGRDLALKRKIPKGDAIHALIARNNNAILVTLDNHFKKLFDITKPYTPKELI